jgi:hypothetical protein
MSNTEKAFNFSPGGLGRFLHRFAKKYGLKNPQEAVRQIIRERKQAEEGATRAATATR